MNALDRSLQIVSIGLGQAGGNIAAELQRRGYPALAFNTARTDLSSLGASRLALPASQRIYIGLEGHDGAGSDADYGRECIAAHTDTIRKAVKAHAAGADVVILAAGLGGGTGSCVAEFTAALADLSLPIVILTTLPHSYESGIAKVNALCGVRDLAKTPSCGWALLDNARLAGLHRDAPMDSYFETINREIVEPLDVFNRLNDRDSTRAIRTFDGEDFRTLLLSGGVLSYGTTALPKLGADAVIDAVRTTLTENPMMPGGGRMEDVAYLGLVIEASERALAESPFSLYEAIANQLKRETGGAAVYVGLYRQHASEDDSTLLRILSSSHALPGAIQEMMAEAEREAGTIEEKMKQSMPHLDLAKLERLRVGRRPVPRAGRPASSASPIAARPEPTTDGESAAKPARQAPSRPMAKVAPSAPAAAAASATATAPPAPVARPEAKPSPKAEMALAPQPAEKAKAPPKPKPRPAAPVSEAPPATKVEELRRIVASGPATAAATSETEAPSSGDPSRGRYERLANAFLEAKADEKRLYIARELVAAQRSGEALERFYSVNAMVRVDPTYFRDALANAAKDSDPHVADLARRALEKLGKTG